MKLYVVAYPEISAADRERIDNYRKSYDRIYGLVDIHFTFVFMVDDMAANDLAAEIRKQAAGFSSFSFSIRCATVNKDSFTDNYFTFLVPDEGFSNIIKLHDKLYNDKLFRHRRLDIDYIPHIEIANSPDKMLIKRIADEWNAIDFEITGTISSIEVINFENRVLTTIEKIELR
jgi:hypothetical protein